jgi:hypothetical protein
MQNKYRRPLIFTLLAALLAFAAYFFRDKIFKTDGKNPDVKTQPDLDNPEIKLPERFQWEKFVTRDPKLMLPTRILQEPKGPELRISTDCVVLDGRLQPVVHVTYETTDEKPDLRVDATLLYQGFEQNRFTLVYPLKVKQRFLLAANSALMSDTSSLTILGASQFPVLKEYRIEEATVNLPDLGPAARPGSRPTAANPAPVKRYLHHFQLGELANGTAYRVRVSEADGDAWSASPEVVITTPFCPNDEHLSER